METRKARTINDAIATAKQMVIDKDPYTIDFATFMIVPEIYKLSRGGYLVVLKDDMLSRPDVEGELVGYFDGRFKHINQVRAAVERDKELDNRATELMARKRRPWNT